MKLHVKIEAFEARLAFDEDLDDAVEANGEGEEHDMDCECDSCELPRARRYLQSEVETRKLIREELTKAEAARDEALRAARRAELKADAAVQQEMERQAKGRLTNGVEMNRLRDENAKLKLEAQERELATQNGATP